MTETKECCAQFDPHPWDKVTHEWKDKPFITETIPQFLHMPLPWMYKRTLTRMWEKAKALSLSFSWVLGQQNSELTSLLRTKAKGKRAVTTTQTTATSSFGILDYEISLPVSFELGLFTLAPSATYVVPLNVVDASTTKSFINLEFSISLTIR